MSAEDSIESLCCNVECVIRSYDVAIMALLKINKIQETYGKKGEEFDIAEKAIARIQALKEEFGDE